MTTRPAYSVALPPSNDVTAHARAAAELGYARVWVFDSPSLYGDLWVALARIAEAVPGIGLATGVAVPSLRHPMVTASAIATIEDLSPGRLWAYFGTGFTARFTMGQPSVKWADLALYLAQVRGLLRGDVVEIDGAAGRAGRVTPPQSRRGWTRSVPKGSAKWSTAPPVRTSGVSWQPSRPPPHCRSTSLAQGYASRP